jgi:hypothetical protein
MNTDTFYSGAIESSNTTKEKRVCRMQGQLKAPILQISETRGNPVEAFSRQATPIGRVVQLRLPFSSFTWHRPVAVEVRKEETIYRLPINDPTMRVISVLVSAGLAIAIVTLSMRRVRLNRRKTL